MVFSFDLTTDVGKVRLLIPDRRPDAYVFEDEDIAAFLAMEDGNVKLTAALALEAIASDTAMVQKVIRLLDLSTDGARVAEALMQRARELRAQASAGEPGFDWAEIVVDDFSYRERLWKEGLRDG